MRAYERLKMSCLYVTETMTKFCKGLIRPLGCQFAEVQLYAAHNKWVVGREGGWLDGWVGGWVARWVGDKVIK